MSYVEKMLKRDKKLAQRREKSCYFCGHMHTVRFAEHWTFCPECAAIYTYMLLLETRCKHIKDSIPFVSHDCWFKKYRQAQTFIKYNDRGQVCSKCGEECYVDGW